MVTAWGGVAGGGGRGGMGEVNGGGGKETSYTFKNEDFFKKIERYQI